MVNKDNQHKKKILIVSTVPESAGLGGVTIHTQRLINDDTLNQPPLLIELFDYKKKSLAEYIKSLRTCDTAHIHISNPKARIIYILLAKIFRRKVIFTIHGNLGRHCAFLNHLDNLSVRLADVPLLINKRSYEKALLLNRKALITTAFIPPKDDETLPSDVGSTIQRLKSRPNTKLFVTNASHRNFDKDGNEIYGVEFLIRLFRKLSDYNLLISDSSGDYADYYKDALLPDNIAICSVPHSFYEVIKCADCMVRATSTDGDSISVKEALYIGKPVLTTDCVDRPDGVITFRYDDADSFISAIERVTNIDTAYLKIETSISLLRDLYIAL